MYEAIACTHECMDKPASSVQAVVACNCAEGLHFSAFHCPVCVSVCLSVSPHAVLAVRAITSKTKDTIVLSVKFEAIVKWRFS